MGIEDVDAHQPRPAAPLAHEVDGTVGAPTGLMQLRGDVRAVAGAAVARIVQRAGVEHLVQSPDLLQPVTVGVAAAHELGGRHAVVEHTVAVVGACFDPGPGRGEVQLAGEAAIVAHVGQAAGDQAYPFVGGEIAVAVAVHVHGVGIETAQKAGAARLAHRALAVGAAEGHALLAQPVEDRRLEVRIVQAANGVIALLIGADPEDVGPPLHWSRMLPQAPGLGEARIPSNMHGAGIRAVDEDRYPPGGRHLCSGATRVAPYWRL